MGVVSMKNTIPKNYPRVEKGKGGDYPRRGGAIKKTPPGRLRCVVGGVRGVRGVLSILKVSAR